MTISAQMPVDIGITWIKPGHPDDLGMEAVFLTLLPAVKFSDADWQMLTEPIRRGFHDSFEREGTPTEKWWPLAEQTQLERMTEGYEPSHPILQRTEKYLRSWVAVWDPKNLFEVKRYFQLQGSVLNSVHIKIGSKDPRAERPSLGDEDAHLPPREVHIVADERLDQLRFEMTRLMLIKIRDEIPA